MICINFVNNTIVFNVKIKNKIVCEAECKTIRRSDLSNNTGLLIAYLETNIKFRNKGYGTKMINYIFNFCKKYNFEYILLDDCSDNIPPHNIYYKLNCYVKKFNTNSDYIWVKWNENTDVLPDEERLWLLKDL